MEDKWANTVKFPAKNWPEDYDQENGNYQNKCSDCGEMFMGNKHRFLCKECEIPSLRFWERLSKTEPPKDNKCAHAGCWANGEMTGFARCMVKNVFPLQSEIDRLKNDLLDALDLKEGNGPTSLSMLKGEIDRLKEERQELVKIIQDCKPAVLHCYEQSSRNGAHQEFLSEDRDLMRRMEEATRIK